MDDATPHKRFGLFVCLGSRPHKRIPLVRLSSQPKLYVLYVLYYSYSFTRFRFGRVGVKFRVLGIDKADTVLELASLLNSLIFSLLQWYIHPLTSIASNEIQLARFAVLQIDRSIDQLHTYSVLSEQW